jgi:hypothetical protein
MTGGDEQRLSLDDKLRGRFLVHLEELEAQQVSFDRVAARLGEKGFVAAWTRDGTPAQNDDKGAVERAYEQIVNELQEMFDDTERRGAAKALFPDPEASTQDWWQAADRLGITTAGAQRSERPGRWRRLAYFSLIDHEFANALNGWCDSRNLFQHGYSHRNSGRGAFVWASMQDMRSQLAAVVSALIGLRDRVAAHPAA